jgi:hypothetical protein
MPPPPAAQDLQCLGRDLAHTIIVDNSPHSYAFQPENAVPIGTFIDDPQDQVSSVTPPGQGRGHTFPGQGSAMHAWCDVRGPGSAAAPPPPPPPRDDPPALPFLLQELLDCLDVLLAIEPVEDVRRHLAPFMRRHSGADKP